MREQFVLLSLLCLLTGADAIAQAECEGTQTSVFDVESFGDALTCGQLSRCSDPAHVTRLWAQEQMGLRLMNQRMSELGVDASNTAVAIVDSGIDLIGARSLYASPKVSIGASNSSHVLGIIQDSSGHGSTVGTLIGGRDGVGGAPRVPLTFYRDTDDSDQSTLNATMKLVKQACDEGHKIINLSAGTESDERGTKPDEAHLLDELEYLRNKGCLVVRAAGNSGVFRNYPFRDSDDGWLRIAGTSRSAILSPGTSQGELAAPGADVFVLSNSKSPMNSCKEGGGHFIDGTSYSAPLVTGVAAYVRAVLDTSKQFQLLSGSSQIAIINRVLQASLFGGIVHGYRAVELASLLIKSPTGQIMNNYLLPTAAQIRALSSGARCSRPAGGCAKMSKCGQITQCLDESERHLLMCGYDEALLEDYVAANAARLGHLEKPYLFLAEHKNRLRASNPAKLASLSRLLLKAVVKTSNNSPSSFSNDASFALALKAEPIAALQLIADAIHDPSISADDAKKIASHVLAHVNESLSINSTNRRADLYKLRRAALSQIAKKIGKAEIAALASQYIKLNSKQYSWYTVVDRLITIDLMLTSTEFSGYWPQFMAAEPVLLDKLHTLQRFKPGESEISMLGRTFKRNSAYLKKKVKTAVEKTSLAHMSEIEIQYVISRMQHHLDPEDYKTFKYIAEDILGSFARVNYFK